MNRSSAIDAPLRIAGLKRLASERLSLRSSVEFSAPIWANAASVRRICFSDSVIVNTIAACALWTARFCRPSQARARDRPLVRGEQRLRGTPLTCLWRSAIRSGAASREVLAACLCASALKRRPRPPPRQHVGIGPSASLVLISYDLDLKIYASAACRTRPQSHESESDSAATRRRRQSSGATPPLHPSGTTARARARGGVLTPKRSSRARGRTGHARPRRAGGSKKGLPNPLQFTRLRSPGRALPRPSAVDRAAAPRLAPSGGHRAESRTERERAERARCCTRWSAQPRPPEPPASSRQAPTTRCCRSESLSRLGLTAEQRHLAVSSDRPLRLPPVHYEWFCLLPVRFYRPLEARVPSADSASESAIRRRRRRRVC